MNNLKIELYSKVRNKNWFKIDQKISFFPTKQEYMKKPCLFIWQSANTFAASIQFFFEKIDFIAKGGETGSVKPWQPCSLSVENLSLTLVNLKWQMLDDKRCQILPNLFWAYKITTNMSDFNFNYCFSFATHALSIAESGMMNSRMYCCCCCWSNSELVRFDKFSVGYSTLIESNLFLN